MFDLMIKVIPGLAVSCAFFLFVIFVVQFLLYYRTGYARSKFLMLCALFATVESLNHFVAQSRLFSVSSTFLFMHIAVIFIHLYMILYLKALSYFIAVPTRVRQGYYFVFSLLSIYFVGGLFFYLSTGESLYFLGNRVEPSGNYFLDSYQVRLGAATSFITIPLALAACTSIITAAIMLNVVWRSSRDKYFMIGLALTILFNFRESLLLPLSVEVYVPLIFFGNIFEVFRMNTLSYREYVAEKMEAARKSIQLEMPRYQNSNLSDARIKELGEELHALLRERELFLNPNLSSEDLAKSLGIPSYQLSQVINIGLGISFFELLGEYRINKVIERFKDPGFESKTIIDIAYESGFNSKSSFNTGFKKHTGLTPSAYRKQIFDKKNKKTHT